MASDFDVLRDLKRRKETITVPSPSAIPLSHKLFAGMIIGCLMGLAYAIVSQNINDWSSPGIPFTHVPFGKLANTLVYVFVGGLLGTITTWPRSAITGIAWASLTFLLFNQLLDWLSGVIPPILMVSATALIPGALLTLAIEFAALLPLLAVLRGSIDDQFENLDRSPWSWTRLKLVLFACLIAACLGYFSLYQNEVRQAMGRMQLLIDTGLKAHDLGNLPEGLRNMDNAQSFLIYATHHYELDQGNLFDLKLVDPEGSLLDLPIVARFNNDYVLICLMGTGTFNAHCQAFFARK